MTVLEAASQELVDLEAQLAASNPELYRHLALYLQVLRDGLLNTVQQACFHLATQVYPDRYRDLDRSQRLVLHRRLRSLVQRATSLLTVEQLAHLAAQIAREERRRHQRRRNRLLGAMAKAEAAEPGQTPQGSVHLGLALPIGANFLDPDHFAVQRATTAPELDQEGEETPTSQDAEPDLDVETMQAMAEALSDWLGHAASRPATPWDGAQLPRDPILLLAWMSGFEQALGRRLRNLSHALNVELLRLGLTRTLLPVSLLDAALAGQLESLEAPTNLLRLPLPFGPEPGGGRLEALAMLLRPADLELEMPKLRTCRTRIQQHRHGVRRMAQHYRRLQRRVQSLEAEQLWLQDINPAPPHPTP